MTQSLQEKWNITWHREDQNLIIDNIDTSVMREHLDIPMKKMRDMDWRSFAQSVVIDFHHSTPTLQDPLLDSPLNRNHLVSGRYAIPQNADDTVIIVTDIFGQEHRVHISKEQLWND